MSEQLPPPPAPESVPPSDAPKPSKLPLVALIIAIIAFVFAVIPGLSLVAWLPAIAAIVLAIVSMAKKAPGKGKAIAALIIAVIAWLVAIIVSVSSLGSDDGPEPIKTPTATESATAEGSPTPTATSSPEESETSEPSGITNGDWLVGSEVAPGQYRAELEPGLFELCTVSQADKGGEILDVRNASEGSVIFTVKDVAGSVLSFSGCQNIALAADVIRVNPNPITNGDWLVGAEVPAGQYRANVAEGIVELCTISQSAADGNILDVNNGASGSVIMTLSESPGSVASFSGCADIERIG